MSAFITYFFITRKDGIDILKSLRMKALNKDEKERFGLVYLLLGQLYCFLLLWFLCQLFFGHQNPINLWVLLCVHMFQYLSSFPTNHRPLSHYLFRSCLHEILCERAMGHWATTKHYIFLFLKATHNYHFFIIIHSSTPKNSLHLSQHLLQ